MFSSTENTSIDNYLTYLIKFELFSCFLVANYTIKIVNFDDVIIYMDGLKYHNI